MDQHLPINLLQSIQPLSTLSAPAAEAEGSGPATGRWSPREHQAVGQKNWNKISDSYLNGRRTLVQCRDRWQNFLKPGLRKGMWTQVEDDTMRSCIEQGMTHWDKIADAVPGRTNKQCRVRWHNHLDPAIKKTPWTEEEDKILDEAQAEYGNKWALVAKLLPGRTDSTCVTLGLLSYELRDLSNHPTPKAAKPTSSNPSDLRPGAGDWNKDPAQQTAVASKGHCSNMGRRAHGGHLGLKGALVGGPSGTMNVCCRSSTPLNFQWRTASWWCWAVPASAAVAAYFIWVPRWSLGHGPIARTKS
jgi:hypothetical protein